MPNAAASSMPLPVRRSPMEPEMSREMFDRFTMLERADLAARLCHTALRRCR